mmetsp:Transcript_8347/g.34368  ORF Transcript_8347/g.34368 Transcript_8347/m.34368 type:complete len:296 (-) Transcript_8347:234-1121(-)
MYSKESRWGVVALSDDHSSTNNNNFPRHGSHLSSDVAARLAFVSSEGKTRFSRAARRAPHAASGAHRLSIVADLKRRSSLGVPVASYADAGAVASEIADFPVDAVSVCTDELWGGRVEDLAAVRSTVARAEVPILCKDLFVDPVQVALAAELGADAVLLIACVLGSKLEDLLDGATVVGLEAVVEVHTPDEVRFALNCGATTLLVNARDRLGDDPAAASLTQAVGLRDLIPPNILALATGGIRDERTVRLLAAAGYDGLLVGRAVVGQPPDRAEALVAAVRGLETSYVETMLPRL